LTFRSAYEQPQRSGTTLRCAFALKGKDHHQSSGDNPAKTPGDGLTITKLSTNLKIY